MALASVIAGLIGVTQMLFGGPHIFFNLFQSCVQVEARKAFGVGSSGSGFIHLGIISVRGSNPYKYLVISTVEPTIQLVEGCLTEGYGFG